MKELEDMYWEGTECVVIPKQIINVSTDIGLRDCS